MTLKIEIMCMLFKILVQIPGKDNLIYNKIDNIQIKLNHSCSQVMKYPILNAATEQYCGLMVLTGKDTYSN